MIHRRGRFKMFGQPDVRYANPRSNPTPPAPPTPPVPPAVAASLVDQGVTYEAKVPGAAGNSIALEIQIPLAPAPQALAYSEVGNDMSVSLGTTAGVKAWEDVPGESGPPGPNYTWNFEAKNAGTAENGRIIRFLNGSALDVDESTPGITQIEWDAMAPPTYDALKTYVNANSTHVNLDYTTDGTPSMDPVNQSDGDSSGLANGTNDAVSSTTAQVAAAVQVASTLVNATGGSGATAGPLAHTHLSGGSD